jgi:hypothetical protein
MDHHDELTQLHAMRTLLETRLMVLEQAINDHHQHGTAAPDLEARVEILLGRLRATNNRLAAMRGSAAAR